MTIAQMRALLGLGPEVSDAAVAEAYALYLDAASASASVSVSPLTLEQAKQQLEVVADDDDDLIERLLSAAVDLVERHTGLILSRRSVVEHADTLGGEIRLRAWPIASIDAVAYRDRANEAQLLDPTLYRLSGARPGYVAALGRGAWPHCTVGRGSVTVTLTAGYAEPNDVPATILQALSLIVAEFYANREAGALSKDAQRSVKWLLDPHRMRRV